MRIRDWTSDVFSSDLLDTAATEEIDLAGLDGLADSIDLARHWQATLDFLDVIRAHWPAIKAETGRLDAAEHRRVVTDRWIAHWQAEPPQDPVLAAGSTGSNPAPPRWLERVRRHAGRGPGGARGWTS